MAKIALKENQEITHIHLEPADNGGCALRYTLHTPYKKNSESSWDEKLEIYQDDEMESLVLPRIMELYRAEYSRSRTKYNTKTSLSQPDSG